MSRRRKLIKTLYVPAVITAGLVALLALVADVVQRPDEGELIACATLAFGVLLGELFPVRVGGEAGEVAFSSTFTFALLIGWGPGPALAAQLGACVVAGVAHRSQPTRLAFNLAQYVLAIAAATAALALLHDGAALTTFAPVDLLEVTIAAAAFFLVNTGVVAGVVALHSGVRVRDQVREELRMQTGTEGILLGMAPLALVGVMSSPVLIALLAVPLLAVQRAGRQALDNEWLALHDGLTGLANRECLSSRFGQALVRVRRAGTQVAVLVIDLDGFKDINDTLGHHAGDEVLCEVAKRICSCVREEDTVARLGGDEFAVLLQEVESAEEALATARRVMREVSRPLEISGVAIEPAGSIGVACHPEHGDGVETLLRHADIAMYSAKELRSGAALYAVSDERHKLTQLKLAGRLGHAIAAGEIELRYQPQVRPLTGEVIGVEALARWQHPQFGLLGPDQFVPLAERSGHMLALTVKVIDDALEQLARWSETGIDLQMAVNLSSRSLTDDDLPDVVASACERSGVDPSRLVLEITEGMLLEKPERAIAVAERLAAQGVGISVDDFGTGFSSLEQLVRLPAVELKIDRSFVMAMGADARSAAIVRCVADLGHSLGLRIVAEGVEDEQARRVVEQLGCDLAQGYLWARPLEADQLAAFATQGRRLLNVA